MVKSLQYKGRNVRMDHTTRSSYMLYMKTATNIKSTLNGASK